MILGRATKCNLDSLHERQLSEFLVLEPLSGGPTLRISSMV